MPRTKDDLEYNDVKRMARQWRIMSPDKQSEVIARSSLEIHALWEIVRDLRREVAELEKRVEGNG